MPKIGTYLGYAKRICEREASYRRGRLQSASLELTYRCNLKCEICSLWQIEPGKIAELSTEEWVRVVDELGRYGVRRVGLIGGEPTIVRGFDQIMERVKHYGIRLDVTTNGTTLPKHVESLCKYADIVYVSIDAPDELHDRIRGVKGVLARILDGLAAMVEYKRRHGLSKPELHVHYTVTKHNVSAIGDTVRMADQIGVDVVSFQYITCSPPSAVKATVMDGQVVASDRYTVNDITTLLLGEEDIPVFREQLAALPATHRAVAVTRPIGNLSDDSLLTGVFPVRRCMPGRCGVAIQPDGNTVVCSQITGYSLGNVREKTIKEIWTGAPRKKMMDRLSRQLFPVCRNCCGFSTALTPRQLALVALGKRL